MTCVSGYGTYDPDSDSFTPKYARITSVGTDGTASNGSTSGRRLRTTYVITTTNTNIVGGQIRINPAARLDGPSCASTPATATPTENAPITLRTCAAPPKDAADLRLPQRPHASSSCPR